MSESNMLETPLMRDGISRRGVISGAMAVAASGLILPASLAQAQDAPRKGGTLRLGLGGGSTTESVDPRTYTDSVMIAVGHALFNGLVEWDADGKPIPQLASSWDVKNGATEWVLNLRKGIKFSNGKEFDADDAIYSLNLHRGASKSGGAAAMKPIKEIKKLDSYQIQLTLDAPDADFAYALTDYHILMVPNGHTDWAKPIGTGAFTLEKFEPGVRILLKSRGNYWKPGKGNVDAVEITVINDNSARLNALISGQVDAINRLDPKAVPLLQKNANLEVVRAPGGWHAVMAMQTDLAPFNNLDFRIGMKHALDREQVLKTLFNGFGELGNDHPIPKSDPYHHTQLKQIKHDPEKAKFHFKKAGISDPKVVLQSSDGVFNGAVDMATLLQASTAAVGVKMDVKKEPADGFWSNVWLKGPFVASYWGGRAAATQMLGVAFKSGADWNETHWTNEKFDKLLADARAETNEAKRKNYIWAMQEMLSTDGGALIPVFRDWLQGKTKKLGGLTPHGGFDMDNGYICEKAWLRA